MILTEILGTTSSNTIDSKINIDDNYLNSVLVLLEDSINTNFVQRIHEYFNYSSLNNFFELHNLKMQFFQFKYSDSMIFKIWNDFFTIFFWEKIYNIIDFNNYDISKEQLSKLKEIINYFSNTLLLLSDENNSPSEIWNLLYSFTVNTSSSSIWKTLPNFEKFEGLRVALSTFFLECKRANLRLEDSIEKASKLFFANSDAITSALVMENYLYTKRLQQDNYGLLLKEYLNDNTHFEMYKFYQLLKLKGHILTQEEYNKEILIIAKKIIYTILSEKVFYSIYYQLFTSLVNIRTAQLWEESIDFQNVFELKLFHIYLAEKIAVQLESQIENAINEFLNSIPLNISLDNLMTYLLSFGFEPTFNEEEINTLIDYYYGINEDNKLAVSSLAVNKNIPPQYIDDFIFQLYGSTQNILNTIKENESLNENFNDLNSLFKQIDFLLKNGIFEDKNDFLNIIKLTFGNYLLGITKSQLDILFNQLEGTFENFVDTYMELTENIQPIITNPNEYRNGIINFLNENIKPVIFTIGDTFYFEIMDLISALKEVSTDYLNVNKEFIKTIKIETLSSIRQLFNNTISNILINTTFNPEKNIESILDKLGNTLSTNDYLFLKNLITEYIYDNILSIHEYIDSYENLDLILQDIENFKNDFKNGFERVKNNIVDSVLNPVERIITSSLDIKIPVLDGEVNTDNVISLLSPFVDSYNDINLLIPNLKNTIDSTIFENSVDSTISDVNTFTTIFEDTSTESTSISTNKTILANLLNSFSAPLEMEGNAASQVMNNINSFIFNTFTERIKDLDLIKMCESFSQDVNDILLSPSLNTNLDSNLFFSPKNNTYIGSNDPDIPITEELNKVEISYIPQEKINESIKNIEKEIFKIKKAAYPVTIVSPLSTEIVEKSSNPAIRNKTHKSISSKKNMIDKINDKLDSANKKLDNLLTKLINKTGLASLNRKLLSYSNSLINLANAPAKFLSTIDKAVTSFLDLITSPFRTIANLYQGIVDAFNRAGNIVNKIANKIKYFCKQATNLICSFLQSDIIQGIAQDGFVETAKKLATNVSEKISGTISKIKDSFKSLIGNKKKNNIVTKDNKKAKTIECSLLLKRRVVESKSSQPQNVQTQTKLQKGISSLTSKIGCQPIAANKKEPLKVKYEEVCLPVVEIKEVTPKKEELYAIPLKEVKLETVYGDVPEYSFTSEFLPLENNLKNYLNTHRVLSLIPGERVGDPSNIYNYTFKYSTFFLDYLNKTLSLLGVKINNSGTLETKGSGNISNNKKEEFNTMPIFRFIVDANVVSETINNEYVTSKFEEMANFGSSLFRQFNQMNFNLNERKNDSILSLLLQPISNLLNSLKNSSLGPMGQIFAGGRVDLPKVWESHSFLSDYSFSIKLVSRIDQKDFINRVLVPLAILLTLACPRLHNSPNVYFWPFVVSAIIPGIAYIPMGAVTKLEIEKISDEGFITEDGKLFGLKVNVDITPLYSILPISDQKRTPAFGLTTASYLKVLLDSYSNIQTAEQTMQKDLTKANEFTTEEFKVDKTPLTTNTEKCREKELTNCAKRLMSQPSFNEYLRDVYGTSSRSTFSNYVSTPISSTRNPNIDNRVTPELVATTICAESSGKLNAVGSLGEGGASQVYSAKYKDPNFYKNNYPQLFTPSDKAKYLSSPTNFNNGLTTNLTFNYKVTTAILDDKAKSLPKNATPAQIAAAYNGSGPLAKSRGECRATVAANLKGNTFG